MKRTVELLVTDCDQYLANAPSPSFLLPLPIALRLDLQNGPIDFNLCVRYTDCVRYCLVFSAAGGRLSCVCSTPLRG